MKRTILALLASFFLTFAAQAATVVLAWDARPVEEQISTYNVYQKVNNQFVLLVSGNVTEIDLVNIQPGKSTFAVAAVNIWGEGPLTEVSTPPGAGGVGNVRIKEIKP